MPGVPSLFPRRLGLGPGPRSPGAPAAGVVHARASPRLGQTTVAASQELLLLQPSRWGGRSPGLGRPPATPPGVGGRGRASREGCLTPGGTPGKDPLPFPSTMSENLWLFVRLSLPRQGGCVSLGPVGADQALSPQFAFAGEGRQREGGTSLNPQTANAPLLKKATLSLSSSRACWKLPSICT